MSRVSSVLSIISVALALTACGQSPIGERISSTGANQIAVEALSHSITVTSAAGLPVAGARVLIGARENVPFPGNLLTTDASGSIQVPTSWVDAQPVTIDAPGFVRATYFGQLPTNLNFSLRALPPTSRLELKGLTKGFGSLARDGFLDVGLVFPALARTQVAMLDVMGLISPETDRMSVFGQQFDIPSNLTFPTQQENYGFFTLTFDKPTYRTFFSTPGTFRMVAAHARFPMKKTVDELRAGKSVFEVINFFEFIQASLKDVPVNKSTQSMDLDVNQIKFTKSVPFTAPNFDSKFMMLAVALADQGGLYFPSDLKRFMPGEKLVLTAPQSNSSGLVVSVLKRDDGQSTGPTTEEMSAVTVAANQSTNFDFLDIVAPPSLRAQTLALSPPRPVSGVEASLTYAVLSKVDLIQQGKMNLEKKTPQWELYAQNWVSNLELPEMPAPGAKPSGQFRWEVLFGGAPSGAALEVEDLSVGPKAFEKVSHVTRSAFDF
jgi:hypothetical protein